MMLYCKGMSTMVVNPAKLFNGNPLNQEKGNEREKDYNQQEDTEKPCVT
jgi:hypothetical protein